MEETTNTIISISKCENIDEMLSVTIRLPKTDGSLEMSNDYLTVNGTVSDMNGLLIALKKIRAELTRTPLD